MGREWVCTTRVRTFLITLEALRMFWLCEWDWVFFSGSVKRPVVWRVSPCRIEMAPLREPCCEKVDHSRERLRSRLIERSRILLRFRLPAGADSSKGRSFAGAAALSPSVSTNG